MSGGAKYQILKEKRNPVYVYSLRNGNIYLRNAYLSDLYSDGSCRAYFENRCPLRLLAKEGNVLHGSLYLTERDDKKAKKLFEEFYISKQDQLKEKMMQYSNEILHIRASKIELLEKE